MEFKGTKGKWKVGRKSTKNNIGRFQCYVSNGKIIDSPICTVFGKTNEQTDSTALLISKAPEMLKMLKNVVEIQDKYFLDGIKTQLALRKI